MTKETKMPTNPIIATTQNANIHKLRAILARERKTSEDLAKEMGMDIGNVLALLHASNEYVNLDGFWTWKGAAK
jgi:hypothetical protein